MSTPLTRQEMEDKLVARAWQDESFKQELLSNPRAAFEKEGIPLPESINIQVVEETADTIYFILPLQPSETEELSDAELESVAGGVWGENNTKNKGCEVTNNCTSPPKQEIA